MKNQRLKLKQLDRQFEEWRSLRSRYSFPPSGWVQTIRTALGMTAQQLATRLGVQRRRVVQIEEMEVHGAITVRTLKAAAEALECDLVYLFLPKQPLEDFLKNKALEVAKARVKRVAHSMSLEDQSVNEVQQNEQIEEFAKQLLEGSLKKLWNDDDKI